MDEIKNEKKITIYMDDVPSNYLESITDLSFIGYNIREYKNGIFYIPITPKKLDKYNLLSPTVFIKFPFTPECFYKEVDTMFRDDNMVNIFVELFFGNNKTTKTTRKKIESLKKNNKIAGDDIIGYLELKFDCRKLKEYRFPKPLSFKVILNDEI